MVARLNDVISNPVAQPLPLLACPVVDANTLSISLADGSQLQQLTAYRVLPARRWVFSADWQGQKVFAKVFLGQQADKYAARDAQGARWMLQAGLKTPDLLWQGLTAAGDAQVLVFAAVERAESADACYGKASEAERLVLLKRLVATLASQHAAGLMQTDLHLKNFLLADGMVWSIDGDGIKAKLLSVRQAHKQLAELLSKISVLDQHAFSETLLQTYLLARQWPQTLSSDVLLTWAKRFKTAEVNAYVQQKIFRNCSDIEWLQTSRAAQAVSRAGGLHATDMPALEVAMHVGQSLKLGNTCTVMHTQLQDRQVVIKRYNIKNGWHAFSRAWRPSRAAASWSNAHRLQYHDIVTPQPLLMLETRCWGMRGSAYFVTAFSPWPDALVFFKQTTDKRLRAEAVKQLSLLCYQFYLLRLSHGDMKATNLQITDHGQVVVMDLDSMRQHHCAKTALRAHVKDLRRLLQNWKDDTSLYNALVKSLRVVYADAKPLTLAGLSI